MWDRGNGVGGGFCGSVDRGSQWCAAPVGVFACVLCDVPRRLLIALILCVLLGLGSSWLFHRLGVGIPWYVPLIAFGAIFAGVALNTDWTNEFKGDPDESPVSDDVDGDGD